MNFKLSWLTILSIVAVLAGASIIGYAIAASTIGGGNAGITINQANPSISVSSIAINGTSNSCSGPTSSFTCDATITAGQTIKISVSVANSGGAGSAYSTSSCTSDCTGVTVTDSYTSSGPLAVAADGSGTLTIFVVTDASASGVVGVGINIF